MKIDLSKYPDKRAAIAYMVANKRDLIEFKRSTIKHADAVGGSNFEANLSKALNTNYNDDPSTGIIKRTIILNTYNWMDSHDDVHMEGTFTKSINERQNKIWHLHDHKYELTAKVGTPLKIYEKSVAWTDLGVNKTGSTIALFMDSNISRKMNEVIFDEYLAGNIDQHSVGMQYIKIELAVNDEQYKDEFAVWNSTIHLLGNRPQAEEKGFYWTVRESKLIEGSAVLAGSNELTPTVPNQPLDKGTGNSSKGINYEYLNKHF